MSHTDRIRGFAAGVTVITITAQATNGRTYAADHTDALALCTAHYRHLEAADS